MSHVEIGSEVRTKVNNVMHQGFEIPLDQLQPTATLFDDLGLDSLDAVDMLVLLEENLGIKVDAERLQGVRTLEDVYILVADLTAASNLKNDLGG